jgi:hypothetical protein
MMGMSNADHSQFLHDQVCSPRFSAHSVQPALLSLLLTLLGARVLAHPPMQSIDMGRNSFSLFLDEDLNDLPPLLLQNVDADITSLFNTDMGS